MYPKGVNGQYSATAARRVDFVGDTIDVGLTTSSWSPSQTGDDFYSTVTNELTTANGYTAGGAALGSKSISVTSLTTNFIGATTTWTASSSGITANKAFVYKSTGTGSTSPLIMYVTFGGDNTAASGSTFNIVWDATNGLFKVVCS
jgi:hypothetical protein